MQKVWNWIVDKKTHTVRQWRGMIVGNTDHSSNHLSQIDNNSDEIYRKQSNDEYCEPSGQIDYQPTEPQINFEEFFNESANAIQTALERRSSRSPYRHHFNVDTKNDSFQSDAMQDNDEFDSRSRRIHHRSESARMYFHSPRRPRSRKSSSNYDVGSGDESGDAIYESNSLRVLKMPSRSPLSRRRCSLPQASISFIDQPSTSAVTVQDRIVEENEEENSYKQRHSSSSPPHDPIPNTATDHDPSKPTDVSACPRQFNDEEKKKSELLEMRRQSNIQFVELASGRRNSTTLLPLTQAQIHLIRSLWRQVYVTKGPTVIGSALFHRIFFKSVKTREQFRTCPVPAHFPNQDSFSKSHCKAASELIDQVVENLNNLESVSDHLLRIGKLHARISEGQLSGKMWNLAAETFIDCTLEWGDKRCRSETVRKAWALIIAFTFEKIKEGHASERRLNSQLHLSTVTSSSAFDSQS